MDKDFGILYDPPDYGKMGIGNNPIQQQSKYGIGLDNGNDYSVNGMTCEEFWNAVLQKLEQLCTWYDGPPGGPGCGIGADFMVSEEEIIL